MVDTINFAALEDVIEGCRLDEDWIGCKSNLDQYAKIFEVSPPFSTQYHSDLKMMKAYYWLCLAECTFSGSGDFDGAIDCLRRGIAIRSSHRELQLVTMRILLRACQDIVLEAFPVASSSQRRAEKVKFEGGVERASLAAALGERYKELPEHTQQLLNNLQAHPTNLHYQMLVSVLVSYPPADLLSTILPPLFSLVFQSYTQTTAMCVVMICRGLVERLKLDAFTSTSSHSSSSSHSTYSHWLHLDSIYSHSILGELIGDHASCLNSLATINNHIQTISHANPSALQSLPSYIAHVYLLSAARVPLVYVSMGLHAEAIASCKGLVAGGVGLGVFLPLHMHIMLGVLMCDCVLKSTGAGAGREELQQVFAFFASLLAPHHTSTAASLALTQSSTYLASLPPIPPSLLHAVHLAQTQPLAVCSEAGWGVVGICLGALMHSLFNNAGLKMRWRAMEDGHAADDSTYDLDTELHSLFQFIHDTEVHPPSLLLYTYALYLIKKNFLADARVALISCAQSLNRQIDQCSGSMTKDTLPLWRWLQEGKGKSGGLLHIVGEVVGASGLQFVADINVDPQIPLLLLVDVWVQLVGVAGGSGWDVGMSLLTLLRSTLKTYIGSRIWQTVISHLYLEGDIVEFSRTLFPDIHNLHPLEEGLGGRYSISHAVLTSHLPSLTFLNPADASTSVPSPLPFLHVLQSLGMVYAEMARGRSVHPHQAFLYSAQATRIFHALLLYIGSRTWESGAGVLAEEIQEIMLVVSLHYSICLAEVGLYTDALHIARRILADTQQSVYWSVLQPRYHHLLALLLPAVYSDEIDAFIQSTFICTDLVSKRPDSWNLIYTQILVAFNSGENKVAANAGEVLLVDMRKKLDHRRQEWPGVSITNSTHLVTPCPVFRNVLNQHSICSILIGLSKMFASIRKFSLAKICLAEAWQCLYGVEKSLADALGRAVEGLLTDKHSILDLLRHVPTPLGWRLAEGYGWDHKHDFFVEADILAMSAHIIQLEDGDMNRVVDLYCMAHATCPYHTRSTVALAQIYFNNYQAEVDTDLQQDILTSSPSKENAPSQHQSQGAKKSSGDREIASKNLALAMFYARSALKQNSRYPDAWQVYSLLSNGIGADHAALEAEVTAAELSQCLPLRPLSTVLW